MPKIVFDNLDIFPSWLQTLIVVTWGACFVVIPLFAIIKIAQTKPMQSFFLAIATCFLQFRSSLRHQVDDPIKYPKIERFLEWLMMGISYVLSAILFISFIVLLLMWAFSKKQIPALQELCFFGYLLVCVYFSAALKTQANRLLLKLRDS